MAMSQMRFSVMSLFITLMPSPCSTMDMTEKLSSVVKRTLGVTPVRRNSGKPNSFSSAETSWFTPEGV